MQIGMDSLKEFLRFANIYKDGACVHACMPVSCASMGTRMCAWTSAMYHIIFSAWTQLCMGPETAGMRASPVPTFGRPPPKGFFRASLWWMT